MKNPLKSLLKPSRGAGMTEYSLLIGLIALLALGGVVMTGRSVQDIFYTVAGALSDSVSEELNKGEGDPEEERDIALDYDLPEGSMVLAFQGTEINIGLVKGAGEAMVHWRTAAPVSVASTGVYTQTFEEDALHIIGVSGDIASFTSNSDNLIEVLSFGDLPLTSLSRSFMDDYLLERVAPLPASVTDMTFAFASTNNAEGSNPAGLEAWDTSSVADFSYAFWQNAIFDGDLSQWDVSATNLDGLSRMFDGAGGFTGDLGTWCVDHIPSQPAYFGADFALRLPAWGFCGTPDQEENPDALMLTLDGNYSRLYLSGLTTGLAKVYWGDGSVSSTTVTNPDSSWTAMHSYRDAGEYKVQVEMPGGTDVFRVFEDTVLSVDSWGTSLATLQEAFSRATKLESVPPLPERITNLSYAFTGAENGSAGANPAGVSEWDVSHVTNMEGMFRYNETFNQDISDWDVTGVPSYIGMRYMFEDATGFTGDLGTWCVDGIDRTPNQFGAPNAERQPAWGYCGMPEPEENPDALMFTVSGDEAWIYASGASEGFATIYWGDGQVSTTNFAGVSTYWSVGHDYANAGTYQVQIEMPGGTDYFRVLRDTVVSVDQWGTALTNLAYAFQNMPSVQSVPPLPETVTNLAYTFQGRDDVFTGPNPAGVAEWDVSRVTNMQGMFLYNGAFDQDVSGWDVSAVASQAAMTSMFEDATAMIADLGDWCVDKITSVPASFGAPNAARQPAWGYCGTPEAQENPDALLFSVNGDEAYIQVSPVSTGLATIFWGDGQVSTQNFTNANSEWTIRHSYAAAGAYQVQVEMPGGADYFKGVNDTIVSVDQWGTGLKSLANAFYNAPSLVSLPPLPATVTNLSNAFSGRSGFNVGANPAGVAEWDVSNVTNMQGMFQYNGSFTGDVSNWDVSAVSSVTSMYWMFQGATGVTADLGNWCVDKISREPSSFGAPNAARQPAWGYCGTPEAQENADAMLFSVDGDEAYIAVSSVSTGLATIFWGDNQVSTYDFTNANSEWTVSHSYAVPGSYQVQVEMPGGMDTFKGHNDTLVSVDQWGVGLTTLESAFLNAPSLVSLPPLPATVTNLKYAFRGHASSNTGANPAGVAEWDVSNVTNMMGTFQYNAAFDGDVSGWDVTSIPSVSYMSYMFDDAEGVTADLGDWCVDKLTSSPSDFGAPNAARQPAWGYCGTPEPQANADALIVTVDGDSSQLNLSSGSTGFATVFWGDGQVSTLNISNAGSTYIFSHDYDVEGVYQVQVELPGGTDVFRVAKDTVVSVDQWGTGLISLAAAFQNMRAIESVPPLPATVTNLAYAFRGNNNSGPNPAGVAAWDVSNVTNMTGTFYYNPTFDQNLAGWNVTGVPSSSYMKEMFQNADGMTSDLSGWCVTKITSAPSYFGADNAAALPLWGSCPGGE